jgi:4'-phosphopantetheinyl transferase EntD
MIATAVRRSKRLEDLLPAGAVAFECDGDGDVAQLAPAELAHCAGASVKRLAEFAAGRACAKAALRAAGVPSEALLPGVERAPQWPRGITGSITHTSGFCSAAVVTGAFARAVGIDAERIGRVDADMFGLLFTQRELQGLSRRQIGERATHATILFSAKESFYKLQFPAHRQWIDFTDVEVDVEERSFRVRASDGFTPAFADLARCIGRYYVDGSLVITGIACT